MYTDYDAIIIGSGVAGLTAAIYCARAGFETCILEKEGMGGEMMSRQLIENYPGFAEGVQGPELANAMLEQASNFGVEMETGEVTGITDKGSYKVIETEDGSFTCKGIILATGCHPRLLNVPGEKELFGKGVYYCATCDGAISAGKPVFVAGGGDSGLTEALALEKLGCQVTVVEFMEKPKASQIMLDRAEETGHIEVLCNYQTNKITGTDWVDGIEIQERTTGEVKKLDVQGGYIRIGNIPNTAFLKDTLDLLPNGQVPVDVNLKTAIDGIYAAGDIRQNSVQQIVTGAGDGATAAMNLGRYLNTLG